tara:strand:+ start:178 stop:2073 length:1896 start_codon:yes stop_codon:yes gene_type:complete
MAYSKTSNKTQDKDVKYLSKDFNSFKNQLMEFAEVYYPNTFNDFSEGSPGMMFIEMAAHVGDVLSFYTDTQLQETFLNLSQDRDNLYNLAYSMGYKPKVTAASTVELEIYQLVPATIGDSGEYSPDFNYTLKINEGSTFKSSEGPNFRLNDRMDFDTSSSFDPTEINVYQVDTSNNPQYYLLKKKGTAISAESRIKNETVGSAQQYLNIDIFDERIIGIESIVDSSGYKWEEVDYLAQDTKFEDVENIASNDPTLHQYNHQSPYLLKLKKVPRRFTSRFLENGELRISFGAGISDKADEEIIPNPDNIGLGIKDGKSKLGIAWDPSNFLHTRAYGQAPANTTLTIKYLVGGGLQSNVSSNTITSIDTIDLSNKPNLNGSMLSFTKESVAVTNPAKAQGGGTGDTTEELRQNTMANFAAQNRIVTKEDYMVRTLSMPAKFGRIAKVFVTQDDQLSPLTTEANRIPNPLALNLYTLGYDKNQNLEILGTATKRNLQTYLEQHRMLTDAINIKDAFVINVGIDFEIVTYKSFNNQEVLLNCIAEVKEFFNPDKWQINQPIIISEIYNLIGGVTGVMSVQKVTINNKTGETLGYSKYKYDLDTATKNEIVYTSLDPSIFEVKNPNQDIQGRVNTY